MAFLFSLCLTSSVTVRKARIGLLYLVLHQTPSREVLDSIATRCAVLFSYAGYLKIQKQLKSDKESGCSAKMVVMCPTFRTLNFNENKQTSFTAIFSSLKYEWPSFKGKSCLLAYQYDQSPLCASTFSLFRLCLFMYFWVDDWLCLRRFNDNAYSFTFQTSLEFIQGPEPSF